MEGYLSYITNIVSANQQATSDGGHLQPVFGIALESRLDESVCESLSGYRGTGPVRIGNSAYTQIQNDGYGSVILASTQSFFDSRLENPGRSDEHTSELQSLMRISYAVFCLK